DDAIVCEKFMERAEEAIINAIKIQGSDVALNFYFGNRSGFRRDFEEGMKKGYTIRVRPHWGVAICLPTNRIDQMIKECDQFAERQDDVRIGKFLINNGIRIYFPLPSLIDHRLGSETKSLVGDIGEDRHAYKFIDSL
ncbi:MAG TPA: hypothetical protein PKG74_03085, partial [Candidatus Colwellbacteria bacterium]|nr:hypothetical protein [Candidatus Colwellbacteria bacterium]